MHLGTFNKELKLHGSSMRCTRFLDDISHDHRLNNERKGRITRDLGLCTSIRLLLPLEYLLVWRNACEDHRGVIEASDDKG